MSMSAVERRRWTAREVRELIAHTPLATPRYELVDGELLVTPSPNLHHQRAVKLLLVSLQEYLAANPIAEVLFSPFDVEVEPESVTQPDLFVLPLSESRRLADGAALPARELLVAIEVLSPSSARHDRVRKRPLYQRHVPEYWIADVDAQLIERWRPNEERPEIIAGVLEWSPVGSAAPFRLDLPTFFASVSKGR